VKRRHRNFDSSRSDGLQARLHAPPQWAAALAPFGGVMGITALRFRAAGVS
jgi:hypothetical protein